MCLYVPARAIKVALLPEQKISISFKIRYLIVLNPQIFQVANSPRILTVLVP